MRHHDQRQRSRVSDALQFFARHAARCAGLQRLGLSLLLLAGCGGGSTPEQPAPAPPVAPPGPPLRTFERALHAIAVNGTRLTYRLSGDSGAAPVVFIHGTLADYRSWSAHETLFAQSYRVLVYSRRFHRPNPQVPDSTQSYSPKLHAEDLAALLLTLDLAPAHVVGSSYGAYAALALALDHPNLVRSLVLAEPPMLPLLTASEAGDTERRAFYLNALDPARRAFARGDSVTGVRSFYDAMRGRGSFESLPPALRADLLAHSFAMRAEMLANREQYLPTISCAELGRVTTPVLLVRGEQSPRIFQLITDELARCLRSDTTVTIPGAGHPPHAGSATAAGYFSRDVLRYFAAH